MKTYKLIAICIASLFFGACSDGLDEAVGLHVEVATNENVSFDGQIITAKKGTPIEFILSGDPDFLTFFSGEAGSKYEYRERETIDPSQIKSSMLNFSIWFQYGNPSTTLEKHVYISDEFTGLYKDNFEADSLLVEQFEKDGKWKELVPQSAFPTAAVGNAVGNVCELIGPYVVIVLENALFDDLRMERRNAVHFVRGDHAQIRHAHLSVRKDGHSVYLAPVPGKSVPHFPAETLIYFL